MGSHGSDVKSPPQKECQRKKCPRRGVTSQTSFPYRVCVPIAYGRPILSPLGFRRNGHRASKKTGTPWHAACRARRRPAVAWCAAGRRFSSWPTSRAPGAQVGSDVKVPLACPRMVLRTLRPEPNDQDGGVGGGGLVFWGVAFLCFPTLPAENGRAV